MHPLVYTLFQVTGYLDTGVLPEGWKRGHVTPLYKKGGCSCPNNYRSITLTSVVGKILESITVNNKI